jgi:hypothetical protein
MKPRAQEVSPFDRSSGKRGERSGHDDESGQSEF